MSKRSHKFAFDTENLSSINVRKKDVKKHSLDSDEEDSGAEEERRNVLRGDAIEGEEDGVAAMEGEITITPFNMKEELEEGHFDKQGHYHWKKEKEISDGWLDNIDWVRVGAKPPGPAAAADELAPLLDPVRNYRAMLEFMRPGETVAKALQRLGGGAARISSAERWRRKKAGLEIPGAADVARLTELANQLLTHTGNMDVYQETYEVITSLIAKEESKKIKQESSTLDMYADDFDVKEKEKIESDGGKDDTEKKEDDKAAGESSEEPQWEVCRSQADGAPVEGPHSTRAMLQLAHEGGLAGAWVRRRGQQGPFYSSSRVDFELYL